jgi:CDP-diacylglycerol--glycerol-3-phosphate 3-phosphatidyltransferase
MVLQCVAIVAILLSLMYAGQIAWLATTSLALLWAAIAITIYSGYDYVIRAARVLREVPDSMS